MFPDVDDQDLTRSKGKKGTLALEVLVLAALATVCTLDIHNQDVVGHLSLVLVLGHPDALCGLATFPLGHDAELGAEQVVQESRLAGGLGAEDGDEVVVEAGLGDVCLVEVLIEVGVVLLVLVDDLDAVLEVVGVAVGRRPVAVLDGGEVAVHGGR